MPEVTPEKNLEIYRQCEIRRPSLASILEIDGQEISKPAGYYFDVVWIKNNIAQKNKKLEDGYGNEWIIAETYGTKPMAGSRGSFKVVTQQNIDADSDT